MEDKKQYKGIKDQKNNVPNKEIPPELKEKFLLIKKKIETFQDYFLKSLFFIFHFFALNFLADYLNFCIFLFTVEEPQQFRFFTKFLSVFFIICYQSIVVFQCSVIIALLNPER